MNTKINNIDIRIATAEDAAYIALLGRVTFTETFGYAFQDKKDLMNYYNVTFSVDKIKSSIEKSNNVYWIAFVNKLAVGYAKLKLDSSSPFVKEGSSCQLQKIYVLNDFLSMRVGLNLQNALLAKAKALHYGTIWLSVLHSNERAINFYTKNGFKKIGEHDFQIGKEIFSFIAMAKVLS